MLRIYRHPTNQAKIIATYHFEDIDNTSTSGEFLISELPTDQVQAREYILSQLTQAAPDDLVILEVDDRDEQKDDFQPFLDQIGTEINWLDTLIGNFGTLSNTQKLEAVERLARENRAILKALRYLAKRL